MACVLAIAACGAIANAVDYQHGYAFLSTPKYTADFTHFDYVNPSAPKGGQIRLPEMGAWDNFNVIPLRGRLAAGVGFWNRSRNLLYDSLLEPSLDEPASRYGLLAEGLAIAEDGAWIAFKLREGAKWHDGVPITTDDLVFSFDVYQNLATPTIRTPLDVFSGIEVIGPREVRYLVKPELRGNPVLPLRLGGMPVLPKHYWAERDITKTTVEPPLGSGPYAVKDFEAGRWITFERVDDYWGKDLPVNRGRNNFDVVKFDYFRDDQIKTEAVKGHAVDLLEENLPRRWATTYDFPAVQQGFFKTDLVRLSKPAGLWWPIFWNLDQPRFQDVRVREALWLVSDFYWHNKRDYGFWGVATSFFHASNLAAQGLPDELELELLEPIRDLVPPRVFTQAYRPPPNGGHGWHRENVVRAAQLLEEAGWVVVDDLLTHVETGESFNIRFLAVSPALGGSFIPYTRTLRKLGITSSIKSPEISNWLYRMRSGDFDGGAVWFLPDATPTMLVTNQFSSATADQDYSSNWSNMRDPAVDHLIEAMYSARTYPEFVAAVHALDRVLLWNFYFIPGMSKVDYAMGYWDKFGQPELDVNLSTQNAFLKTWWWDEEKAARVRAFTGRE